MKTILFCITLLCSVTTQAQYYYNDIISTQETSRQMKNYVANKVKSISATGYDERGVRATDFTELQEVKENGTALKISTIVQFNKTVIYSKFDSQGRLIQVTDSSSGTENITTYTYDAAGRISRIQNTTKDPGNDFTQTELHQWLYTSTGRPEKMWRTINNADSLEIRFIADENDNAGEEVTYSRGRETEHYYYYYDEQHRITDVVRYNKKVKKLIPDNMISYDNAGRAIQVISSTPPDKYGKITWVGYQIWRYVYNEQGLKTAEGLFNNEQEMTGRIKYNYTFGQ